MPKALLDFLGYKFFFWSNENAEPPHVHVCRGKQTSNATKFWITADGIKLDHNKSQIPQNDLKKIARYILENRADILAAWFDYFNSLLFFIEKISFSLLYSSVTFPIMKQTV